MGYMFINDTFNVKKSENTECGYDFSLNRKQSYLFASMANCEFGKVYSLLDVLKDYCKKALQNQFKPSDLINGTDLKVVAQYMQWDGFLYDWTDDVPKDERTVSKAVATACMVEDKEPIKLSIRTTAKGNYTFMLINNGVTPIKAFKPKTRFHITPSKLEAGTFDEFLED